jgi:uncharacterized membrane-anchored protein
MTVTKKRPERTEDGFVIVHSEDELPQFESEAEEAAFWDTHTWSEEMMDRAARKPRDPSLPRPRTRQSATSIRFDKVTLRRLKTLAERRGVGYQTLLKTFVAERLYEEEKREGIVG